MQRFQCRHQSARAVEGTKFQLGTVSTMNGSNIRSNDLLAYPDDHWNDGECFVYSGTGAGGSRIVSDFAATLGEVTPFAAWDTAPVATDLFEMHQHDEWRADDYNKAIDLAILAAKDTYLTDKIDTTLTMQGVRFEYPIPSGFRYVGAVHMDTMLNGSDYWGSDNFDADQALFDTSATTKLSQAFVPAANDVPSGRWVGSVRLFLRLVGSMSTARTLTLKIETDTAGAPSGTQVTNASATLLTSSVPGGYGYCDFAFTNPVWLTGDTTYHLVLSISGTADSTNYIAWGRDDSTSYGSGAAAKYSGAAWSTIASAALIFTLGNPASTARFAQLAADDWDVIRSDKLLWIRRPTEGRAIRILGQGQATALTADTDTIPINEEYVVAKASAIMLSGHASGPQLDLESRLQRATFYENLAGMYKAKMRVTPRPNSRIVDAR
ncbi:MAG: choice-of-anchor R domain-containing protein [Dehalococcoidia bacterium]|nr:choice-of-anchor R domain-containing protein [Dehalococcoidia bacterium]